MIGDILQPTHLLFILVVALLVLGPKRLPEVGRSLGKGIRDFKGALSGIEEHTNFMDPVTMAPSAPPTTSVVPGAAVSSAPAAPPIVTAAASVSATVEPANDAPVAVASAPVAMTSTPAPVAHANEPAPADYAD